LSTTTGPADTTAGPTPETAAAPAPSGSTAGASAHPSRPTATSKRPRHRLRLFMVGAVLVGAVVFLLVEGIGNSLDYFDTVGQAVSQKASLGTGTFRLEGLVVPGSIHNTSAGTDFEVSGNGHTIAVHNTGSPPELFQPNIPVVAVGHFASRGSYLFLSNQILVKHTSSYSAAHPGRVRAPNGSSR
jgi:cytochrome c-type biogenesis protein CcmE